jgi:hypothetical protein
MIDTYPDRLCLRRLKRARTVERRIAIVFGWREYDPKSTVDDPLCLVWESINQVLATYTVAQTMKASEKWTSQPRTFPKLFSETSKLAVIYSCRNHFGGVLRCFYSHQTPAGRNVSPRSHNRDNSQ